VLAQPELPARLLEVLADLGPERVLVRPVVALQERVAVAEVAGVQSAPRIVILQPDAADVGVALEDHEAEAGLEQPVGHGQTGHARPDDGHP